MKRINFQLVLSILLSSLLITSCLDDPDLRTREDEIAELADYIIDNNITTQPTWTGLYYLEDSVGSGETPEYLDTIIYEYEGYLLNGKPFEQISLSDEYSRFQIWDGSVISGMNHAISYMKEGGKARVIIPSDLAYSYYSYGSLEPYSTLIYDINLINIIPGIEVDPYIIEGIEEKTTFSGLRYYPVVENDSIEVLSTHNVEVHYTGYFSNGKIFDSSVKRRDTYLIDMVNSKLIEGFFEGLLLMNVGEKFRFIIPPELAYGEYGAGVAIPPSTTLTFDIEVIDTGY